MKPELVIFDLDGTLLDTIGDLAVSCNHMLRLRDLPQHGYDDYCRFVGNGIMRLVERALPEELRTAEYVKAARKDFLEHYIDHIDIETRPYEGIPQAVETLYRSGVKLAVASNKFQAGTEKLIRPITAAAGVARDRCVMVGDSAVDMQTAHNAGIGSIGVSWGFRDRAELEENRADYIVDTPGELLKVIASMR